MITFPEVYTSGMVGVRWSSAENPWIDVVAVVNEKDAHAAIASMSRAKDLYWDSVYECYGDAVECELSQNGIPYMLVFHDSMDESVEYEELWDEMLSGINIAFNI